MGLRCYGGSCIRTQDKLTTGIPPEVSSFENRILSQKFHSDLRTWTNQPRYHAYLTINSLGTNLAPQAVWDEYLRNPAPTYTGRRDAPIKTGDTSLAVALPLPLGWVEHIVDNDNRILANVTLRSHLLNPGYVVRWLKLMGSNLTSFTLGRGLGMLPETNETGGASAFTELDRTIARQLRLSASR